MFWIGMTVGIFVGIAAGMLLTCIIVSVGHSADREDYGNMRYNEGYHACARDLRCEQLKEKLNAAMGESEAEKI